MGLLWLKCDLFIGTDVSMELSASIFRTESVLQKLLDPGDGSKRSFRGADSGLIRKGVITQKTRIFKSSSVKYMYR